MEKKTEKFINKFNIGDSVKFDDSGWSNRMMTINCKKYVSHM